MYYIGVAAGLANPALSRPLFAKKMEVASYMQIYIFYTYGMARTKWHAICTPQWEVPTALADLLLTDLKSNQIRMNTLDVTYEL